MCKNNFLILWMHRLKGETKQVDWSYAESYENAVTTSIQDERGWSLENSKGKYHAEIGAEPLALPVVALNMILHSSKIYLHLGYSKCVWLTVTREWITHVLYNSDKW